MLQYKPIHRVLFSLLLAVVLMFNGIGASAYFPSSSGSGSGSVGSSDAPYILDTTFVEEQPPYQKPVTYLRIDITKNSAAADLPVSDDAVLHVCFYDTQGVLLRMDTIDIPALSTYLANNRQYTESFTVYPDDAIAKAFLWSNNSTMQPLADCAEEDVSIPNTYAYVTDAHVWGVGERAEIDLSLLEMHNSHTGASLSSVFTVENAYYNTALRSMYSTLNEQHPDLTALRTADISDKQSFADALCGSMIAYHLDADQRIVRLILPTEEKTSNPNDPLTASPVQEGQYDADTLSIGEYFISADTPVFFINGTDGTQAAPGTAADHYGSIVDTLYQLSDGETYTYIAYNSDPITKAAEAIVVYNAQLREVFSYGYIMGHQQDEAAASGGSDGFRLQILTPANAVQDCVIDADTTVVTADPTDSTQTVETKVSSSAELLALLRESAKLSNTDEDKTNFDIQQVVKYTTSLSQGTLYLDKLIPATPTDCGIPLTDDRLNFYTRISANDLMQYNTNRLTGETESISIANAIVFEVPSDRGAFDGYRAGTVGASFRNHMSYMVEVFDISPTNRAKVVVMLAADITTEVAPYSPVYVLTEPPRQESNSAEDATMYRVEGVQINPSGPSDRFEEWVSAESESIAETLDTGTVFRAGTDIDGYLTINGRDILYPRTRPFIEIEDSVLSNPGWAEAEYTAVLGSVYAAESDAVRIAIPSDGAFLESGDWIDINTVENVTITASDFSNAVVYYYDTTLSQPEMVELDAETAISWLTPYADGLTDPSEVLFYMSDGRVKLFIVID